MNYKRDTIYDKQSNLGEDEVINETLKARGETTILTLMILSLLRFFN